VSSTTPSPPEMAARHRDRVDRLASQFVGHLGEIAFIQARKSEGAAIVSSKGVFEGIVTGASSKQDRKPVVAKAVKRFRLKTKKNLISPPFSVLAF